MTLVRIDVTLYTALIDKSLKSCKCHSPVAMPVLHIITNGEIPCRHPTLHHCVLQSPSRFRWICARHRKNFGLLCWSMPPNAAAFPLEEVMSSAKALDDP